MKDEYKTKQELSDELKKLRHEITTLEKRALKKAHDESERRALERTADLFNVNKKLEIEIFERKQVEKTLLIEKEFSEIIINSSVDGILAFNKNYHYTLWNPGMERISGVNKTDVIGKLAFDVFPFLKETGVDKFFFDTLEGKTIITQDKPYVIPETGQEGFFTGHYSALRNESGKVVGALGIIRDISDQKVWKQKITEKDEFLRKIIHSDLNLMFVKHRNGKYVEVSDGLAELFGTSSDYLVGKTDLELAETRILSTCEAEKIRADDMEVLDTGKKKFIEEESITQNNGTTKWYQTTKVPLILNNNEDYVLGVVVDITLRKQAIDLLKEKESELEVKNENLEELNTALKILLKQREKDKEELEKKVLSSIKNLVEPYVNKLKDSSQNNSQKIFIEIIESNLKEIVSTFSLKLSSEYINLTAYEIQVADLIRKDFANKEIAEQLNMALETVSSHRKHIRKKLGLTNKKTNLSSHLKSIG